MTIIAQWETTTITSTMSQADIEAVLSAMVDSDVKVLDIVEIARQWVKDNGYDTFNVLYSKVAKKVTLDLRHTSVPRPIQISLEDLGCPPPV